MLSKLIESLTISSLKIEVERTSFSRIFSYSGAAIEVVLRKASYDAITQHASLNKWVHVKENAGELVLLFVFQRRIKSLQSLKRSR